MKSQKAAITTLIAISTTIIVGTCAMLFFEYDWLGDAKRKIETQMTTLTNSMARYPFPSTSSIVAVSNNVRTLEEDAALLRRDMNAGKIAIESGMDHLAWLSSLTKKRRDLQNGARVSNVRLPAKFIFGFDRYMTGNPPKVSDVPRLDLQLKTVESLCKIMFQSGVWEIKTITREEFEDQDQSATKGSNAGAATTNETPQFTKEHLTIGLMAKEAAVIDLLNALASSKMFVVVTLVRIQADPGVELRPVGKAGEDVDPGSKSGDTGDEAGSLSAKVITGRGKEKPADVYLELDVYEFGKPHKGSS